MKCPICIWSTPSLSAQRWVKWSLQPGTSLSPGAALGYLLKHSVCKPIKLPLLLFFSCLVVFDSLQPHGLQYTRLPCLLPSLSVCSNSCPLSRWCPPTISSSVIPFSSCPQSFLHQGLCQWVCSSHQVAKGLELQLHQALFTIPKTWRQPQCPPTDIWIKNMWSMYTTEYYSAINRE